MITEGGLTLSGGHTIQRTGDVAEKCTLDTYMSLLTNATPIHVMKKQKQKNNVRGGR